MRRERLLVVVGLLAGCGEEGLTVIATSPEDQATGVEPDISIEATFSRDMAADTIDATTFVVALDGETVAGTVSYAADTRVATFRPDAAMAHLGPYTATITTGATDTAGAALDADSTWRFTVRDWRWNTAELVETDDGVAGSPQVVIDPAGIATVVWYQHDGTTFSIWANRLLPGAGWGTAVLLETDDAGEAGSPEIAVDAAGNATVVWNQSDGARASIWANRFVPADGWGTATLLETDNAGDAVSPQVAVDAAGNATAVWLQSDGAVWNLWAAQFVPGDGWGAATLLETDDTGNAADAQVAVDPAGNATAVWGSAGNIWASIFVPGTGWGTANLIEADPGEAFTPALAVDPSGNVIAAWTQSDGNVVDAWANRFVPGAGWGTASLIEADPGDVFAPRVAIDADGNATAVWQQGTLQDLMANRFVVGSGWGTAVAIETEDRVAGQPAVAVDPAGNATAVWIQYGNARMNIWANHFLTGSGWGNATILETDDADDAYSPQVAVDPVGNATVVWEQLDLTGSNIWANTLR